MNMAGMKARHGLVRKTVLAMGLLAALGTGVAQAQSITGGLYGREPGGSDVTLEVTNPATGYHRELHPDSDGRYNVVPVDQAVAGVLSPRTGGAADARGYELRAVPLQYIAAAEMKKLLEPYARQIVAPFVSGLRAL